MALETRPWDVTEFLDSDERIAAFLEAVFEDGDPAVMAAAIGDVARARGMTQVAREAGVAREALYRSLSFNGNPEFATMVKVLTALGLRFSVEANTKNTEDTASGNVAMAARNKQTGRKARAVSGKPLSPS